MKDLLKEKTYDIILIDSMNLAMRNHYAMQNLSHNGKHTGMLYGIAKFIFKMQVFYPKAKIIFLWEGVDSVRKSLDSSYKQNRKNNTEIPLLVKEVQKYVKSTKADQAYHIGLEADDLAGYYVNKKKKEDKLLLVSNDADWIQFLRKDKTVDIMQKEIIKTYSMIKSELGYPPERIGLWKVIRGDSSDNVHCVKGIPPFIMMNIVRRCSTIYQMRKLKLTEIDPTWLKYEHKISENWDTIKRNAKLVMFQPDWIVPKHIIYMKGHENKENLKRILEKNAIKSLIKEL